MAATLRLGLTSAPTTCPRHRGAEPQVWLTSLPHGAPSMVRAEAARLPVMKLTSVTVTRTLTRTRQTECRALSPLVLRRHHHDPEPFFPTVPVSQPP
eukprot:2866770-Rhodomonas_salina.1